MAGLLSNLAKAAGGAPAPKRVAKAAESTMGAAPPPPAPPKRTAPAEPRVTPEDKHYQEVQKRSLSLPPPVEGHTRLYRQGNVPKDLPPMTMQDVVQTPMGEMPRWVWEQEKAKVGHTNPFGATGRWFTDDARELDYYVRETPNEPTYYVDVPNDKLPEVNVRNTPYSKVSRNHDREFVLPDEVLQNAQRLLDGLLRK
jgi:hypothetical protein